MPHIPYVDPETITDPDTSARIDEKKI